MRFASYVLFAVLALVFAAQVDKLEYMDALEKIDFDAVKADIVDMFTDSQDWWPADYGNYGPFFIRLAWHCTGSYRQSDGRGGCDGGRQRFDPERSWDDNTNLDKARSLLWPIKEKYGLGLSWGDLITLTGTTAIESMGGPVLGYCAGRIDDTDGSDSILLGPTAEQEILAPCETNGECEAPLGTSTIGLIYVNPEGPMGNPEPSLSYPNIRDTFGRMSMNDSETVALIGGGHAFGKVHGACPAGPGKPPKEDPENPWPGLCGDGKGINTFTSGFEGPWTYDPTTFDNTYFKSLLENDWTVHKGPGGHWQWQVKDNSPQAPAADGNGKQDVMMLTTDVSLTHDDTYLNLVKLYSQDMDAFANAFSHAWYKLMSRDMGPATRCFGDNVPVPQPFQNPLPAPPSTLADFDKVSEAIVEKLTSDFSDLTPDTVDGESSFAAWTIQLAWQSASTFRRTDYHGGANGAAIRFSPMMDWEVNQEMTLVLELLSNVKEQFGDELTWADLIVLAGNVALEQSSGMSVPFCGGRSDALNGDGTENLEPRSYPDVFSEFEDSRLLLGLSKREMVALSGRMRSSEREQVLGYAGIWSDDMSFSNEYFVNLLNERWSFVTVAGVDQFKADGKDLYMKQSDLAIRWDAELMAIAQDYASDVELFRSEFISAWVKVMNADRFDGPVRNVCDEMMLIE